MRAVIYPELQDVVNGSLVSIVDERAKHLIKSVRLNLDENVLLLDGHGRKAFTTAIEITKKEVVLKVEDIFEEKNRSAISMAICVLKKDAMEEVVRNAVELGIKEIFPVYSEYSQRNFSWEARASRIAESALIQSNNLFYPEFKEAIEFDQLLNLIDEFEQTFYFSSQSNGEGNEKKADRCLMIIGPEGGLSKSEEERITSSKNVALLKLKTPIMRAPTAQVAAVGWLKSLGF